MYLIKNYGLFELKSNKPAVRVESQGSRAWVFCPSFWSGRSAYASCPSIAAQAKARLTISRRKVHIMRLKVENYRGRG